MAQIVVSFRILPSDVSVDLNCLKEEVKNVLPKSAQVYRFEEDPIAFGLVALTSHIIVSEEAGELDRVEDAIRKIDTVGQIETLMVRRI